MLATACDWPTIFQPTIPDASLLFPKWRHTANTLPRTRQKEPQRSLTVTHCPSDAICSANKVPIVTSCEHCRRGQGIFLSDVDSRFYLDSSTFNSTSLAVISVGKKKSKREKWKGAKEGMADLQQRDRGRRCDCRSASLTLPSAIDGQSAVVTSHGIVQEKVRGIHGIMIRRCGISSTTKHSIAC